MEGTSRRFEQAVELIHVSTLLFEKAEELSVQLPLLRWYLFGSILESSLANDIDLLVIYSQPNEPKLVREVLDDISQRLPLHLLFMTLEEETETQFLSRWPNFRLFPRDQV